MAKVVVECADPNDLDSIEQAVDQIAGRCNVTYFKQAQALKQTGAAKSTSEAARIISSDTGESEQAARRRIQEGEKKIAQLGQAPLTPESSTEIEENQEPRKHIATGEKPPGGEREGAGRPPKATYLHTETYEVTDALDFAAIAISQLERINKSDPHREEAFDEVINWINKNRRKKS